MTRRGPTFTGLLALLLTTLACSGSGTKPPDAGAPAPATAAPASAGAPTSAATDTPADEAAADAPEAASPYDVLPPRVRAILDEPFTGDFDAMVERRLVRVGVVFNRTQYFIDHGQQKGSVYESVHLFEEELNKRLKTGNLKINVVFVPLRRDQLFPSLVNGRVDAVAAALTETPERRKLAAFSNPTRTNVSEVVVTGRDVPPVATLDDLSGREVYIRKSSSYFESVTRLNADLAGRGKPPVRVKLAPEVLEDDDILEMTNAGLVDTTIVDDFVADFWSQVFKDIVINRGAALTTGGVIAVGVRKDNPKTLRALNIWIKEYGPKTQFGNVMNRRYLSNSGYVNRAADKAERKKFQDMVTLFKKYGDEYDLDYVLMAAQGYQESRLNQDAKSHVGAVGVMQVMPATGKDLDVGDISKVEPNIHAGVKYIRQMEDRLYKNEPMDKLDKALMTLASYNAGPAKIARLRKETAQRGLDPNKWFGNVERIVSERVGRETVQYVSNIYKYYLAYKLSLEQRTQREQAREAVKATQ